MKHILLQKKKVSCLLLAFILLSALQSKAQTPATFTATNVKVMDTLTNLNIIKAEAITANDTIRAKDHIIAEQDLKVAGNVSVGGDLLMSNTSNANLGTVNAQGDINTNTKLSVGGNAIISGTLRNTALSGSGDRLVYVDSSGNFKLGAGSTPPNVNGPCLSGALPWYEGGNNNAPNSTIGTCDDLDFILKSNNNPKIWLKNTGNNENIGFGTSTPLQKFHFANGNILLNDRLMIGIPAPVDDIETSVNILQKGLKGIQFISTAIGRTAFEVKPNNNSGNSSFIVFGNGQTKIGTSNLGFIFNDPMLTVGQSIPSNLALSLVNNSTPSSPQAFFNVFGNGQTRVGTLNQVFSANDPMFMIGQSNASGMALSLVNNTNPISPVHYFDVNGNGEVQVGAPSINNVVGGIPVNPFRISINTGFRSGIKLNSNSNSDYINPQIWVGNTQDNKDNFLVFSDGTTYIGDRWNAGGVTQGIYASTFPRLATQSNSQPGQNRAAFSASVKNQSINELAGQKGYCATFESNNQNTRAIAVMCTDPALNLPANTWYEGFKVYADGRTFIGGQRVGGTHSNALLQVSGEITCKSLFVLKPSTWSDKVFDSQYKLMSLGDVEKYIKENNHLPGVKSEKEIYEKGYDLNETDAVLLEKIENLYLYIIEQQKEINTLKKKLNEKN